MHPFISMQNNPTLAEKTTEAIQKIQKFGYVFVFDIPTQKYQACDQNGTVEHEFDNWAQIIAFADNILDNRS